jgi:predicted small lipoprotein YifL
MGKFIRKYTIYNEEKWKMTSTHKLFAASLLIAALVLSLTACGQTKTPQTSGDKVTLPVADGATIGSGKTEFTVEVKAKDAAPVAFTVKTDETTVGAALQNLGVIEGEKGDYGLYIKSVNGTTADYDKDGVYWAFYVDGEYAVASADLTDLTAGSTYTFSVEAGS